MGPITSANSIYRDIYSFVAGLLPESLGWLAYLITGAAFAVAIVTVFLLATAIYTWVERRIIARFQSRLGPNRWGPFGLMQPMADMIKLLTKEDTRPAQADKWIFIIAPVLMFAPGALALAVVPFGKNSFLADLNVGILFVLAVTSVNALAIFMAGWGSANKYALIGSMRGVAQLVSYEVPMVLSVAGILLLAGSMSMVDIVDNQKIPFFLVQPLGFLIFLIASVAEMNRPPFDTPEGESEIVAGYHIEYSGMKFGMIMVTEFAAPLVAGAIATTLFMQGWRGPVLPSHLWFFLKVAVIVFVILWVKSTVPRLRVDLIMGFAWKGLFPLALVNLFVTAIEIQVWPAPSATQLWVMALINWVVMIVSIMVVANVLGQQKVKANRSTSMTPMSIGVEEVK